MRVRAARGAIVVGADTPEQVLDATQRLLSAMLDRNAVETGDLISILFTATDDLTSVFPAEAARRMGMGAVPLMCARETRSRVRCLRWSASWCISTPSYPSTRSARLPSTVRSPSRRPRPLTSGASMPMRVGVIGSGLMGTSIALAAARIGCPVTTWDRDIDRAALRAAAGGWSRPRRWGRRSTTPTSWWSRPRSGDAASVAEVLAAAPRAVVTDVGSVKMPLVAAVGALAASAGSCSLRPRPSDGWQRAIRSRPRFGFRGRRHRLGGDTHHGVRFRGGGAARRLGRTDRRQARAAWTPFVTTASSRSSATFLRSPRQR